MKKALIIGAAGFVGEHLIHCLKNEFSYEVYGTKLDTQEYSSPEAKILNLNILEKKQIDDLLRDVRPDCIFHLAAQSSVALSWANPQLTVDINIKGAVNLFESLRELNFKPRIIVIGSSEEYGTSGAGEGKVDEETLPKPGNIYAATKACQNMLGTIYSKAYDLDIVLVRAFNHIGPRQLDTFVVSDFCKQVAEIEKGLREPVINVGNLSAYRDFTDVRDVVRAYCLLAEKGKKGETYNVGSGEAVQISSILEKIISHSSKKVEIKVDSKKLRPVDVPKIEADVSKIATEVGWKKEISLEETILDVLEWWRKEI